MQIAQRCWTIEAEFRTQQFEGFRCCVATENTSRYVTRQNLEHGKYEQRNNQQRQQRQQDTAGDEPYDWQWRTPAWAAKLKDARLGRPRVPADVPAPASRETYLLQLRSSKFKLKFCARGV
jgi:hypothetical protein